MLFIANPHYMNFKLHFTRIADVLPALPMFYPRSVIVKWKNILSPKKKPKKPRKKQKQTII